MYLLHKVYLQMSSACLRQPGDQLRGRRHHELNGSDVADSICRCVCVSPSVSGLIPLCLYTVHADCYVMHQSSAQGGDTIPITREKHVQQYVGSLMSSLSNTRLALCPRTRSCIYGADESELCFFVLLVFCVPSLCLPLPAALSAFNFRQI